MRCGTAWPAAAIRRAEKNIDIEVLAFEDVAFVQADRRALRTILDNLITNALRYTPEGGHIRIGATEQQDRVHFFVHDNGRGIEAERLPTIFGRFTGDPEQRNLRSGPGPGAAPGRIPGRRGLGGEPSRRGHHLSLHASHRCC